MLIGYARGSREEQGLDVQVEALTKAGCSQVFTDEGSSGQAAPQEGAPALQAALEALEAGDTLVVWRLDRLGRSLKDLVRKAEAVQGRQAGLRSLQEGIDTGQASQAGVFAALAAFEREAGRGRGRRAAGAGRPSARARGRQGGRPREMTAEKLELAVGLMQEPAVSIGEICGRLGVSKSTLYRYVGPDGSVRLR